MSFVQPRVGPGRNVAIGVAVAFHLLLAWGLMNGLGRSVIQAINDPIETRVIEEVKPPPPPPKVIELPPPPKFAPPPPAYVPPPEVQVPQPPAQAPTIAATVAEPPPAPPPVAPRAEAPAPPAPAPQPAPAPPARLEASVVCSNYGKVMGEAAFPREALRAGLEEGSALIQFTLGAAGEVKDVKALQSTHPAFARGAMRIVSEYHCAGQGRDVVVQVPFTFRSN